MSAEVGGMTRPPRRRLYTDEDLLYYPPAHALEDLTCRDLGSLLGCGHTKAAKIKNGSQELDEASEQTLWARLRERGTL